MCRNLLTAVTPLTAPKKNSQRSVGRSGQALHRLHGVSSEAANLTVNGQTAPSGRVQTFFVPDLPAVGAVQDHWPDVAIWMGLLRAARGRSKASPNGQGVIASNDSLVRL